MKREYLSRGPKINLHVPQTLRDALEREAAYRMLSISDIVRESLAARYYKKESVK